MSLFSMSSELRWSDQGRGVYLAILMIFLLLLQVEPELRCAGTRQSLQDWPGTECDCLSIGR